VSDIVAYHEAGHAFAAFYLGAIVHRVTITPDRDDGPERYGDTEIHWPREKFDTASFTQNAVFVALAGPVAEMLYRGEPYHPGFIPEWSNDWQVAWDAAEAQISAPKQRLEFLERRVVEIYQFLDETRNWAAVAALADELQAHETLEQEEVASVVSVWLP